MINRVIWIVLDSVGIGKAEDAKQFNDEGSNTIGNIIKSEGKINLYNMQKLGLGNIDEFDELDSIQNVIGCYGRAREISAGKDTTIGHFEMAGIYSKVPFPTFPNGFPEKIIKQFEKEVGRKVIGNKVASGTEIIKELGKKHQETGDLIIYTSADSVFQIAAHEEVVSIEELYKICEVARKILVGEDEVARVIARPFIGEKGNYERTDRRKDFSVSPPRDTVLDKAKKQGLNVQAVGKIEYIFNKKGITEAVHTHDNMDGVTKTLEYMKTNKKGIIYTNLVDFDMLWGHRRNVKGYKEGLEEFDRCLPKIMDNMNNDDLLIITADHGCDPTYRGTDHTRENVPVLVYGKQIKKGINLGELGTYADMGQTICDIFDLGELEIGESFLNKII